MNKTTIVITHDLSQITDDDFVYVMKNGELVEQGFRADLEDQPGEFSELASIQRDFGGHLPTKEIDEQHHGDELEAMFEEAMEAIDSERRPRPFTLAQDRASVAPQLIGNWMFDAITDLTVKPTVSDPEKVVEIPSTIAERPRPRRPSSMQVLPILPPAPPAVHSVHHRRSLQFTPTSATFSFHSSNSSRPLLSMVDQAEKPMMELSANESAGRRTKQERLRWDGKTSQATVMEVIVESKVSVVDDERQDLSTRTLLKELYATVPCKPMLYTGLVFCMLSGALTPIFSYLLSFVFFEVSRGAPDASLVNFYGGIVLTIAILDGLFYGLKYFAMDTTAVYWMAQVRSRCFRLVLGQDKKWFDKSENAPIQLLQAITKDGEDARELIASIAGQALVVFTMILVGLTWAMVTGWQFTLAGLAIGPVFAGVMAVQSRLSMKCQTRNRFAREEVSKAYYEVCFVSVPIHFV